MNNWTRIGITLAALGTFTPGWPGTNPVAAPAPRDVAPGVWLVPGGVPPDRQPDGNTGDLRCPGGLDRRRYRPPLLAARGDPCAGARAEERHRRDRRHALAPGSRQWPHAGSACGVPGPAGVRERCDRRRARRLLAVERHGIRPHTWTIRGFRRRPETTSGGTCSRSRNRSGACGPTTVIPDLGPDRRWVAVHCESTLRVMPQRPATSGSMTKTAGWPSSVISFTLPAPFPWTPPVRTDGRSRCSRWRPRRSRWRFPATAAR